MILLPAAFFYAVLFSLNKNIPLFDDYGALEFANRLVKLSTFHERFLYYLGAQHNEYKLFLGHGLVWLQLASAGHMNFAFLSVLGDLSVVFIALVLWKMFLPSLQLDRRLKLFLPVSLLLFQFQYLETLNWPLPGLQNLPVVACALGSIYLVDRRTWASFAGAWAVLVLGISASGNGFIMVPIGMLMLARTRRFAALALWIGAFLLMFWAYSYNYVTRSTTGEHHVSLFHQVLHPNLVFFFGFLGSSARYPLKSGAVIFGLALFAGVLWMIRRGYLKNQPMVLYGLLFVLLTTIGVAGIRANFTLEESMASRYRIYSDLVLIFAWFGIAGTLLQDRPGSLRKQRLYTGALTLCLLLSAGNDVIGVHQLLKRNKWLEAGIRDFERSNATQPPVKFEDLTESFARDFGEYARQTLIEAERLRIYEPEKY